MGKLRLEIDVLEVESFEAGSSEERGTVLGQDSWESCGGTCEPQCPPAPKPTERASDACGTCYATGCATAYGCTC